MLVARRIVNFNLHLLAINVLVTPEDVEDSRLVIIIELVFQEVRDEAGLTHRGITDKHELELLWSVRFLFRLRWFPRRCLLLWRCLLHC